MPVVFSGGELASLLWGRLLEAKWKVVGVCGEEGQDDGVEYCYIITLKNLSCEAKHVWDRDLELASSWVSLVCCFLCCSSQLFLVRARGWNSSVVLFLCQLKEKEKKEKFLSNLRIGFPPPLQHLCLELLECLTSEKSKYFISGGFFKY